MSEIREREPIYGDLFQSKRDVEGAFSDGYDDRGDPEKSGLDLSYADIEIAVYSYENYSGSAFVLYRDNRDGTWYEVHGSHCSCYGLENQWQPEVVDPMAIVIRNAYIGYDDGHPYQERVKRRIQEIFGSTGPSSPAS